MKKSIVALCCCLCVCMSVFSQEQQLLNGEPELSPVEKLDQKLQTIEDAVKTLQKLKVSGYIQAQYQWGEKDASLKVGAVNENLNNSFNRVGIRRGLLKFAYEDGIGLGVFQLDMTEKGVGIKDAYLAIKDPLWETNSFKAGIFFRPFGNEISYSSSRLESTERSAIVQTLFPEERDLGGMFTLQAAKTSPWNFLKLEAGLFAGNGIKQETDNRKDFIGHLSASKNIGSEAKWGLGVSYYNGGVFQGNKYVYTMNGKGFVCDSVAENKGKFAKREYIGFDGQFSIMSVLGLTQLRTEYLFGTQPGGKASSKSPNTSVLILTDTYIRNFSGGYIILVQDLGKSPFSAVLKYDLYDPNTKVSGDEIGLNGTNLVDLAQNTFGFGMLWRINNNLRLQVYYEINKNETTANLTNFKEDIKNDVFTLRMQYKW